MSVKSSLFCSPETAAALKKEPWMEHVVLIRSMPLSMYGEVTDKDGKTCKAIIQTAGSDDLYGYDTLKDALEEAQEMRDKIVPLIRSGVLTKPTKSKSYIIINCKE